MKKIRLCPNWASADEVLDRIIKQFKTPDIDLSNILFVNDDSYDIIVYFNYISFPPLPDKKAYVFPNEPYWVGNHQKNISDYPNATIFGFDCGNNKYVGDCKELPMHMVYGGQGPPYDRTDFWNYENLIDINTIKEKPISCTITTKRDNLAPTCLYPQRFNLVNNIFNYQFIDFFGGWNEFGNKKDALVNYYFNLAVENESSKNLISEKFYDPILTNTIPIYYGCKNIKEIYPEKGYIEIDDINDIDNIKKILININKNYQDIYSEMIQETKKIKNKLFKEYNLLKKIIEL